MTSAASRAVLAALDTEDGPARFVGGCVRDAVLGRPVKDIDIATALPPEDVMARLTDAGIRAIPTGIDHGTVTAVIGKDHFEITTLRIDVETFGRHARVAFTDDWAKDAARRDFTINALFADADGTVYDPVGGLDDLREGRVRFVGKAGERITEDVLRLLRFFRFQAHYGKPPADQEALAACAAMADRLPSLSGERVCGELLRLLLAPAPAAVFTLMAGAGVLAQFLAEASEITRLEALVRIEADRVAPDAIRRLAAVLGTDAPGAIAIAGRLRMSNAERERLAALTAGIGEITPALDDRARRRALHAHGPELYRDLALLAWADCARASAQEDEAWNGLLSAAASPPPALPLKGRDALALGVPQGPEVGRLLRGIEAWWIEGDFQADRSACLERLEAQAREAGHAPPR